MLELNWYEGWFEFKNYDGVQLDMKGYGRVQLDMEVYVRVQLDMKGFVGGWNEFAWNYLNLKAVLLPILRFILN
jgi:hypothetical protein